MVWSGCGEGGEKVCKVMGVEWCDVCDKQGVEWCVVCVEQGVECWSV